MRNLYPTLIAVIFLLQAQFIGYSVNVQKKIELKHSLFQVNYTTEGVTFSPAGEKMDWRWQLKSISGIMDLKGELVEPDLKGNDISYRRGVVTEQYLFKSLSIEQQFVIHSGESITGDIVIEGTVNSDGSFKRVEGGWNWAKNKSNVFVGDVFVFDATGKALTASMEVTSTSTRIIVDYFALKDASFPVTIDPQIGPDDFVLNNDALRAYQPKLIYSATDNVFFSSWTKYAGSGLARNEDIFGGSFTRDQVKSAPKIADQVCNYSNFKISKDTPSGSSLNSTATQSDVAYSGSNYLTVWENYQSPENERLIRSIISSAATTTTDVVTLFNDATFSTTYTSARYPAVAGNNSKFLVLSSVSNITSSSYNVLGKYIQSNGVAEATAYLPVFSSSTVFTDVDIDAIPSGNFAVAASTLNAIYYGRADNSGTLSGIGNKTGLGKIGSVSISAKDNSNFLVVWSELTGSGSAAKYTIKGAINGGTVFQIDDTNQNGSGKPSVAYNPDSDSWLVAWQTTISTNVNSSTTVWAREILSSGTMNNLFIVSKQSRTSVTPTVAYDSQNHEFWIAWSGGGNKDQLLAQRWTNSMSDCIISLKRDTIHENNYKGSSFNPATDKYFSSLKALNSQGDSIYPLDFIVYPNGNNDDGTKFQTSYIQASNAQTPTILTLDDYYKSKNKLFYVDDSYINYELKDSYNFSVYAQSEITGSAGRSSTQTQTVKVVDMNEQMSATFSPTVSFLEDEVNPKIPFIFNSGDEGYERNSILLTATVTPTTFNAPPTLSANPSIPGGGHTDAIPRTKVTVQENLLFSLKPNVSGIQTLTFTLTDQAGGTWSAAQKDFSRSYSTLVTITSVNDAPTFTAGSSVTVNEDAVAQTVSAWATSITKGAPDESSQTLSFIVSNNNNSLFSVQPSINATSGDLTFTPATDNYGTVTVTVILKDDGGTLNGGVDESAAITFTITVNSVNDAPVFTKGANKSISEDSGLQTVNGWATALSKGPANESSQVLTFTVTNDNNSLFEVQPDVDETTGTLTFTPKANVYGTATVSVTLSDNGGTANGGVDNSVQTFTITISPINDIPLFTKGADQTVLEDAGVQGVQGWATGISAGNSFEIGQTLTFVVSNDNNALFSSQPVVNSSTGNLTFTPASNADGSATVSVRLEDNGGTANGGVNSTGVTTFIIHVTSVNDAPQFSAGLSPTVLEDSGTKTISGWASGIDAGAPDESGQILTFDVFTDNPALFSVQPSINASGELSFTPAANEFGTASLQITLSDNGGTASGGVDSYTQNGTITIAAVNDKPLFTRGANQTILQGVGAQSIVGWATGISAGATNETGQVLTFSLTNDNTALFDVQPAIDPTTGTLTYTPKASAHGMANLSVQLTDNGGTANGGIDASNVANFNIRVVPVNSAPSFTTGPDVTVNEDAVGSVTWATNIIAGPSYESGQTLTFILNNDNSALFSVQPSIDASTGILTFTPATNLYGTATVTVSLKDDGGTLNSGVDESAATTFTITVNAVNDTPLFVKGADQTMLEDAGTQTVTSWATGMSSGPANESDQTLTFAVTNDNNSLFDVQPDVDETTGTLTYTPKANAYGRATVSVTLSDDGGVDNSVQTFTVTISPVNDVPLFTKGADQAILEDAGTQTVTSWATGMSSGPANESSQTLTFTVTNDNNSLFDVQPEVDEITGILSYTPKANSYGTATVSVNLSDNGGTANGGVDQVVKSFIITVTPVNDVPSFVMGADQTMLEDRGLQTITDWATVINPGNSLESSQTLQFAVTNNNNMLFSVQPSIDAATGTLTYTPADNANGTAVVTVGLTDDGGVDNGGVDASAEVTFVIEVTPVNDAPLFTAGSNIIVNQDANAQSLIWATNITAGSANESGQTLSFILNNNNTTLFSQQPVLNALTGIITFKPAAGLNGVATIQVQLNDNGGTANGGVNVSSIKTFTITVNQVNQQPTFVKGADQSILEDSGSKIITGWATSISSGPASESGQILNFTVTNDNSALFDIQPDVDEISGTLTYTPNVNAYGVALVTVELSDNGGTANWGSDRSTQTFTILISSVNDSPSFTQGDNQTVLEDAGTQTVNSWARNISGGNTRELSQSLQFIVSNNNKALFSIQPAIDAATGHLTYAPANGVFGSAGVSVVLKDNGGTANGGEDTSSEITFTISVTSVNDSPVISTPLPDVQVAEFEEYNFIAQKTNFADPDGDNLTLQITAVSGNWVQKKNVIELEGFAAPDSDDKAVITVRATDPQGLWVEDTFEISIVRLKRPLIYGQIFGSGSLPKELPVILFSANATKPDSVAVTSTITKDYYYFDDLATGSYIVKVVNNNTENYPQLASSYFTSTTDWTKATSIDVKANNQYIASIIMAQNKVTDGVGAISGYARVAKEVIGDTNENEPLAFVDITLTGKDDSNLVLHTQTSTNGSYKFGKLPFGEYVITIAVPGFQSDITYNLKIDEGKNIFENINFLINLDNEVITNIVEISQLELDLYPNPTSGLVNLRSNDVSKTLYVRVIDMNGQVVLKKQFEPSNLVQFDIRNLLPASYLVEVRHEDKVKTFTVLLMNSK